MSIILPPHNGFASASDYGLAKKFIASHSVWFGFLGLAIRDLDPVLASQGPVRLHAPKGRKKPTHVSIPAESLPCLSIPLGQPNPQGSALSKAISREVLDWHAKVSTNAPPQAHHLHKAPEHVHSKAPLARMCVLAQYKSSLLTPRAAPLGGTSASPEVSSQPAAAFSRRGL